MGATALYVNTALVILCAFTLMPTASFVEGKTILDFQNFKTLLKFNFGLKTGEVLTSTTLSTGEGTVDVNAYPNCTGYDIIPCCWSAVGLPCSEFNKDPYNVETCGGQCGIPCVDDITGDPDEGIIVEADNSTTNTCYDYKPEACCLFLARHSLCSETLFKGCRKSCSQCK